MTLGPFAYVFSVLFYKTVFLTVLSFGSSTRLMDQESQRSASLSLSVLLPLCWVISICQQALSFVFWFHSYTVSTQLFPSHRQSLIHNPGLYREKAKSNTTA